MLVELKGQYGWLLLLVYYIYFAHIKLTSHLGEVAPKARWTNVTSKLSSSSPVPGVS